MSEKIGSEYIKRKFNELQSELSNIKNNQNTIASQLFELLSSERDTIHAVHSIVLEHNSLKSSTETINDKINDAIDKIDDQSKYHEMMMAKLWNLVSDMRDLSNQISSVLDKLANLLSAYLDSSESLKDRLDIYTSQTVNEIKTINDSVQLILGTINKGQKLGKIEKITMIVTSISLVVGATIAGLIAYMTGFNKILENIIVK